MNKFHGFAALYLAASMILGCSGCSGTTHVTSDNPEGTVPKDSTEITPPPAPVPDPPAAYGQVPTQGQVAWQRQELIMFYHFGPATFSGYDGDKRTYTSAQLISAFKPSAVDADQWVKTAADNGFKEVILTSKHHDGFCLWDNPKSTCDIAACPAPYNVDVVKAVSDACKKYKVNLGIYMSPWDKIGGSDSNYANNYIDAIKSIADGAYGPITEFWLDGHNASGLDFTTVNNAILANNPDCVIFSNVGPGCRWVGNEDGSAGETNWSTFSPSAHGASQMSLPGDYGTYLKQGDEDGTAWIPAECDFSIQAIGDNNGWFWGSGDSRKTAKQLVDIYYKSVGRNSIFLMNVPPSQAGVIDSKEKTVIESFHTMLTQIFAENLAAGATATATNVRGEHEAYSPANMIDGNLDTYFATDDDVKTVEIEFALDGSKTFNRVVLQEYISLGQRVKAFTVQYKKNGTWTNWKSGTTIGHKRILLGSSVTTDAVKIQITNSKACPVLNGFGLYNDTVSGL